VRPRRPPAGEGAVEHVDPDQPVVLLGRSRGSEEGDVTGAGGQLGPSGEQEREAGREQAMCGQPGQRLGGPTAATGLIYRFGDWLLPALVGQGTHGASVLRSPRPRTSTTPLGRPGCPQAVTGAE
jgi:hypothetical protein